MRVNILGFSTLAVLGIGLAASASAELNAAPDGLNTATPIKHLVVVIGENRSFDHIYGTYVPKGRHAILNLLSDGIVRSDGSPGRHFAAAPARREDALRTPCGGRPASTALNEVRPMQHG